MEGEIPVGETEESANGKREDFGKMKYGCDHYKRRCKIRAPCCNQIFTCRHCHNEAMSSLSNPKERHELVRREVTHVVCVICEHEQPVAKVCVKCGVNMGEYFCAVCRFYDDEVKKEQFHCGECGICRVGGADNFFHCPKCGSCYAISLRDNHSCVENSMKNCCPICYEYLFDSIKGTAVMTCGHTIHFDCFKEMLHQNQYRCPICSKSVHDMTGTWKRLDEEVQSTPMPEEYRYKVSILCNDCSNTSEVFYHIFGHKCGQCGSYNSRIISRIDGLQQETAPIN